MPTDFIGWVTDFIEWNGWTPVSAIVTAIATFVIAWFTVVLARVGKRQIADARILQRAYLSVERQGIELTTQTALVGQVIFRNVGKLPATEVVSVVKKIEVRDATWSPPALTDADLPSWTTWVIPIGAEVPQGSEAITLNEVNQAKVGGDKYLYVYGRVRFKDGFDCERHVNFCHRYPWAKATSGGEIPKEFARYHHYGNKSD